LVLACNAKPERKLSFEFEEAWQIHLLRCIVRGGGGRSVGWCRVCLQATGRL
jgi:hypothetical protein